MPQMSEMKRENIIRAAKAKFDAGQEIIALAMAPPSKTSAEAESRSIKRALARAAYREAEVELERLIHGAPEEEDFTTKAPTVSGFYWLRRDGNQDCVVEVWEAIVCFCGTYDNESLEELIEDYPSAQWLGPLHPKGGK